MPAPSDLLHAWDEQDALPRDIAEESLLEKVERLNQPYVALVSTATEGFLTVELPPHKLALLVHGRTDELSLRSAFALLPGGGVMSLATNSLLNLCAPHGWDAALGTGTDAAPDPAAPSATAGAVKGPQLVCAAAEPGDGSNSGGHDVTHRLLLRSAIPSSRFAVERVP